jgi:hypothetical protein
MSYANISTRNNIGVKRLSPRIMLAGVDGASLGSGASDAAAAGVDAGTIATLEAMGASDAQLEALAQGATTVPALMSQLTGGALPGQSAGSAPNYPAPAELATADQTAWQQQSIQQTGMDVTDPSSWYNVTANLQTLNQNIKQLESAVASNPALAARIGSQVSSLRSDYNDAAAQWIQVYGAVMGSTPTGLSGGLGIAPLILVAAAVAAFIVIVGLVAALYQRYASVKAAAQATSAQASAQQTTAQTYQGLQAQYLNATDPNTRAALLAQMQALSVALVNQTQPPAPPSASLTFAQWFTANWQWVGLAAVVIALGPNLVKKI